MNEISSSGEDELTRRIVRLFDHVLNNVTHSTSGVSPSEMLFKRKIRTRLSTLDTLFYDQDDMDHEICDRDAEKKGIAKYNADWNFKAKKSDDAEGDKVLLKQRSENKSFKSTV